MKGALKGADYKECEFGTWEYASYGLSTEKVDNNGACMKLCARNLHINERNRITCEVEYYFDLDNFSNLQVLCHSEKYASKYIKDMSAHLNPYESSESHISCTEKKMITAILSQNPYEFQIIVYVLEKSKDSLDLVQNAFNS